MSLGFICSTQAKNKQELDTIYANEKMTTALFFPSNIKQGITGSENFVFTYNREKEGNLGLLKAVSSENSNLLVITTDGKVYSYILKYSETIENPNRFIDFNESIGNQKRVIKRDNIKTKSHINIKPTIDSLNLLRKSCESLLKLPEEKNRRKQKRKIKLSLKNLYYKGDHVFLQFEIENKSGVRFDFDYLKIFKVSGNKKRNASYQEIPINPIYRHKIPNQIPHNGKERFVYVLDKFNIAKNERILVQLQEKNTTRNVELLYR